MQTPASPGAGEVGGRREAGGSQELQAIKGSEQEGGPQHTKHHGCPWPQINFLSALLELGQAQNTSMLVGREWVLERKPLHIMSPEREARAFTWELKAARTGMAEEWFQ